MLTDLLFAFAQGRLEITLAVLLATTGESDISRPFVSRVLGALDQEQVEVSGTPPPDASSGGPKHQCHARTSLAPLLLRLGPHALANIYSTPEGTE